MVEQLFMVQFNKKLDIQKWGILFLKSHPDDKDFSGICPYHHDCLEGLVSEPNFDKRLGISGPKVPKDHPIWDIIAYYLAQAVIQQTVIIRPYNVVIGSGVVNRNLLLKIQKEFSKLLNSYIKVPNLE